MVEDKSSYMKLNNSWKELLFSEFDKPHMQELKKFLAKEKAEKKSIYPASFQIFAAFDNVAFEDVKVVILGQDPYHGPGQAMGLSFSVPDGVRLPPSLKNIFKELKTDLNIDAPLSGNLTPWAKQGVLLLNSVLTVQESHAASHQKKGWEKFTDEVIKKLNDEREHLVFILWGAYAQKKAAFVDSKKHLVLKAVHPSPLSAYGGFYGSKPFSKTNAYLKSHGLKPINWDLSNS